MNISFRVYSLLFVFFTLFFIERGAIFLDICEYDFFVFFSNPSTVSAAVIFFH